MSLENFIRIQTTIPVNIAKNLPQYVYTFTSPYPIEKNVWRIGLNIMTECRISNSNLNSNCSTRQRRDFLLHI